MNSKEILFSEIPKTFLKGGSILTSGFKHSLQRKSLLLLALIPIVIAIFAFYLGYGRVYGLFSSLAVETLITSLNFDFFGGGALLWLAKFAIKLLTGLVTFVLFYVAMQLFYIPICSILAERVLVDKGIVEVKTLSESIVFNIKMFKTGLIKAFLLIFLSLACFIVSFIPLLSFVPIYFALLVLSYDSFDYGLELYGLSLSDRSEFVRKESALINGHAGVLFLCSFIPGLLLISLPFSVIGASLALGESNGFKETAS